MSHTGRVCITDRIGQRLPDVPRPGSDASRSPGRGISRQPASCAKAAAARAAAGTRPTGSPPHCSTPPGPDGNRPGVPQTGGKSPRTRPRGAGTAPAASPQSRGRNPEGSARPPTHGSRNCQAARGLHLLHARLVPQLVPGRLAARLPRHAHAHDLGACAADRRTPVLNRPATGGPVPSTPLKGAGPGRW